VIELPAPGASHERSKPLPVRRRQPSGSGAGAELPGGLATAAELEAEHERHVSDAERLHDELTKVQQVVREALAAEESAVEQLRDDLRRARSAIETRDAALAEAQAEADRLRGELDAVREQAERARSEELLSARGTVDAARAEAERVLSRLTSISDALDVRERGSGADERPSAS
jgi:chromosome segregation ATPase